MQPASKILSLITTERFIFDDFIDHEQDHFHRGILPAGEPAPVYIDTADTGYKGGHIYNPGKMGANARTYFL
jgi:hypothetical protein